MPFLFSLTTLYLTTSAINNDNGQTGRVKGKAGHSKATPYARLTSPGRFESSWVNVLPVLYVAEVVRWQYETGCSATETGEHVDS